MTCLCIFLWGGDFQNKVKKIRNLVDRPDEFNGPQDVLVWKKKKRPGMEDSFFKVFIEFVITLILLYALVFRL